LTEPDKLKEDKMSPRQQVLCALNRGVPDRVPWIEIEFNKGIAAKLLDENFSLPYGYNGQKVDEHNNPLPEVSLETFKEELNKWIRLSKKIGLDALGMFFWSPVFAKVKETSAGETMEANGLIESIDELKELTGKVTYPEDRNYDYAKIFIEEVHKSGLAAFFTSSLILDIGMRGIGFEKFCLSFYDENIKLVEEVLDWYSEYAVRNFRQLTKMNPDFIWVAEDVAYGNGPFISPEQLSRHVMPRYQRIVKEITCPWIFHSDGNLLPIMEDLISLGMNAIHPVQPDCMDIFEVKKKYGHKVALVGNVSVDLLSRGAKKEIKRNVDNLISVLGKEGGYLLSSGNCITDYLKPENVVMLGRENR